MNSVVGSGFHGFRQDSLKFDLESHGVSTAFVGHEEFAVAIKQAIIKSYMVIIIIAMEGNIKLVEQETVVFFGIAFCLLSFSDHSIVHL